MKRKIISFVLVLTILSAIVACQIYDQNTNGVIYTAMPRDGEKSRATLIDTIAEKKDATTDLIDLAKTLDETYTGIGVNKDLGVDYNKSPIEIKADILVLWDLKYPVKWDFPRK